MKLYEFGPAPNAQRVRIFLNEKQLELPTITLDVRKGEQHQEPYTTMNPFHCVPFLELDDGTIISESITICRYLEALNPEPALFGQNPEQCAAIDMWNRRIELDGMGPGSLAVRNKAPMFAGRVIPGTRSDTPQDPAVVNRGIEMLRVFLSRFEPHMSGKDHVVGAQFSIADITGYFMGNMAKGLGLDLNAAYPNTARWHAALSERPSVAALSA